MLWSFISRVTNYSDNDVHDDDDDDDDDDKLHINPRTYKQSHTPTVVQGGGLMDPPWVFVMLQYFEKISPLMESL